MTFSRRHSIGEGPQPFESLSKNLHYSIKRCRHEGLAMVSIEIDALELLLAAFDREGEAPGGSAVDG